MPARRPLPPASRAEARNSKRPFAGANPSPLPPAARHDRPRRPKSSASGRAKRGAMTLDGAQQGGEPARTRPLGRRRRARQAPARSREAARIRRAEGRLSTSVAFGYVPRRGGERAGSAAGEALTNPSRSSKARRRSPPGCTPTSRRRPPQRRHSTTSRANTQQEVSMPGSIPSSLIIDAFKEVFQAERRGAKRRIRSAGSSACSTRTRKACCPRSTRSGASASSRARPRTTPTQWRPGFT